MSIPVALAGGIDSREAACHAFTLGADAIQVATRFVTTEECDADIRYKQAYIQAKETDIVITKSPVGMPGRAILNPFLKKVQNGDRFHTANATAASKTANHQKYHTASPMPLIHAAKGETDQALLFCGANAWKAKKIQTVREVMEEILG